MFSFSCVIDVKSNLNTLILFVAYPLRLFSGDLTFVKTINGLQNHPEAWLKLLNEIEKLPEGNEKRKILK